MPQDKRRFGRWTLNLGASCLGLTLVGALYRTFLNLATFDPDRYYHLRLAALMQDGGILKSLPQVEDLGWGGFFPDKEFLFHAFGALAYKVHGESGVTALPPLIAAGIFFACALIAARYVGWWRASVLTGIVFAATPSFLWRLVMLRPQGLAILTFLIVLLGLLRGRRWVVAAGCAAFALSYHAIYLPLLLLGSFAVCARAHGRPWGRIVAFGTLGLLTGIVVNPYFPANVLMGVRHVFVALGSDPIPPDAFGAELHPWASNKWLENLAYQALVVVAGVALWAARRQRGAGSGAGLEEERDAPWQTDMVTGALAVMLALSFLSPRACEYSTPLTVVTLACLAASRAGKTRWVRAATVMILMVAGAIALKPLFSEPSTKDVSRTAESLKSILAPVPATPGSGTGAKIFNCNWSDSPFVFYARPDLRFVDILDPSFLFVQNRTLFTNRVGIDNGRLPDVYPVIKSVFKADYVLCPMDSHATATIENDPNFTRLYPRRPEDEGLALYAAAAERVPAQVRAFDVGFWGRGKMSKSSEPAAAPPWPTTSPWLGDEVGGAERIMFVDLLAAARRAGISDLVQEAAEGGSAQPVGELNDPGFRAKGKERTEEICALVKVPPDEVSRLAGAEIATLGGGPHIRLYVNDRATFVTSLPLGAPEMNAISVSLPAPLAAGDRVQAVVCSPLKTPFFGFALSLWRTADLTRMCRERHPNIQAIPSSRGAWLAHNTRGEAFCLGDPASTAQY